MLGVARNHQMTSRWNLWVEQLTYIRKIKIINVFSITVLFIILAVGLVILAMTLPWFKRQYAKYKVRKTVYGLLFWVLIICGSILLDKGVGGSTITSQQTWGAILVFLAGVIIVLYMGMKEVTKDSIETYIKTQNFHDNYQKYLNHLRKQEDKEMTEWTKQNKF